MDPPLIERKDLSSGNANRLQEAVVQNALTQGLSSESINELKVLTSGKKKWNEGTLQDFVENNYDQLDKISAVFNNAQLTLLSDCTVESEKSTKILCNLARTITKEAEKVKRPKSQETSLVTSFENDTEKNLTILKAMKKLNRLNSKEQIEMMIIPSPDSSEVGFHFVEFLHQYPESLGEKNDFTLAFSIFITKSLQDCYSIDSQIAKKQISIMEGYLKDKSTGFVSSIAKRSFRPDSKPTKGAFHSESFLNSLKAESVGSFDEEMAKLFDLAFGETRFKDPITMINLMHGFIEKETIKLFELIDSKSFWTICQKAISKISLRSSEVIENKRIKEEVILNEKAIQDVVMWGILHMPKLSNSLELELLCLEWVLVKILSYEAPTFTIVQTIVEQNFLTALPLFSINKNNSILSALLKHPSIPEKIKLQISSIDKEILGSCDFMNSFFNQMNFIEQNFSLVEAEKHLQILRDKKYPYLIRLENQMDGFYKKSASFHEKIKGIKEKKSMLKVDEYEELKNYALIRGDSDLIIQLETKQIFSSGVLDHQQKINTVIYHLMLDKVATPELTDTFISKPIKIFAQALIDILDRLTKNHDKIHLDQILPYVRALKNQFIPILKQLIVLDLLNEVSQEICSKAIVKRLNQMQVNDKMLIPVGSLGHVTCLLVTKSEEESFQLTLYNTGAGVITWHPRWKNTNRYQTFFVIDDIPKSQLMNQDSWLSLMMFRENTESMDPIYQLLLSSLGKGGKLLMPSSHETDYEAKQSERTCAMQSIMGAVRHQFMQIVKGKPEEKEAAYKILKANMFHRYNVDNEDKIDPKVRECCLSLFNKISAEKEMVNIAKNLANFNSFMSKMKTLFIELDAKDTFELLLQKSAKTTLERYAILRTASTALCMIWLKMGSPTVSNRSEKVLMLAIAKYEHQLIIMSNLKKRFELCEKGNDINEVSTLIATVVTSTAYPQMGVDYALSFFGEDLAIIQKFLTIINKFGTQMNWFVDQFANTIESNGNKILAKQIRNYWKLIHK